MSEPTEKPSLEEAITWGKTLFFLHKDTIALRDRLIEAGEFERRNASKAFDCYNARSKAEDWRCPMRDKFDRRVKELKKTVDYWVDEAKERLRLLGEARHELAEKEREVERLRIQQKDINWIVERLKILDKLPPALGVVEKKLQILEDKNPGCFDDTGEPTVAPEPTEAEVEKLGKLKSELVELISKCDLSMPPKWVFTTIAKHIDANFVPRTEHEREIKKLQNEYRQPSGDFHYCNAGKIGRYAQIFCSLCGWGTPKGKDFDPVKLIKDLRRQLEKRK